MAGAITVARVDGDVSVVLLDSRSILGLNVHDKDQIKDQNLLTSFISSRFSDDRNYKGERDEKESAAAYHARFEVERNAAEGKCDGRGHAHKDHRERRLHLLELRPNDHHSPQLHPAFVGTRRNRNAKEKLRLRA